MNRTLPSKHRGRKNRRNRIALLTFTIGVTAVSLLTIKSLAKEVSADVVYAETISVEATTYNTLPEEVVSVELVQKEAIIQGSVMPVMAKNIVEQEITTVTEAVEETTSSDTVKWQGEILTASKGVNYGPSGKETYYNLEMSGVIALMKELGYDYEYTVREDGVKLYGGYVMCAANLDIRPKGTIVETSLGKGIVCDTGIFAYDNPTQLDIAVTW